MVPAGVFSALEESWGLGSWIWEFPKIRGTLSGLLIIRILPFRERPVTGRIMYDYGVSLGFSHALSI